MLCPSDRLRSVWVAFVLSALVLMEPHTVMAQYQNERSGTSTAPAQSGAAEVTRGSSGGSSVHVVPTLSVSQRYDSNIFRGAGRQVSDFVTEIRPGARLEYSGDLLDGNFSGGVLSGIYAENSRLSYVGGQAFYNGTFDKMTGKVVPGLGLRYTGSTNYYPEQPAFAASDSAEFDFARGIQAQRNNTLTNGSTVQSTYAMTPLAHLNASYMFQTRRFLGQPDPSDPSTPIGLFDTMLHSISGGPSYLLTPNHSIGASYSYRQISSEPSSGSVSGLGGQSTVIHGAMATWKTMLSQGLTGEISAGASVLSRTPDDLIWTMQANLRWVGQGKSAGVSFSRGLFPSYAAQAATLVSNVVSGTYTLNLASQWSMTLGASYALNNGTGQTSLQFESIGANGTLRYAFYPGYSLLITGSHSDFTIEQATSTVKFDRQMGMLTLTAEWN